MNREELNARALQRADYLGITIDLDTLHDHTDLILIEIGLKIQAL